MNMTQKTLFILLVVLASMSQAQTANMDFEEGTFNNWTLEIGQRNSPTDVDWLPAGTGADLNQQIRLMNPSHPPLDEYGLLCEPDINIPTAFPGGAFSARIGDNPGGRRAARISRTFSVTPTESFLLYSYAIILEEPGHSQEEQPKFLVNIKDSSGEIVECGQFEVNAGTNAVAQGFTECLLQQSYDCDFPISDCGAGLFPGQGQFPVQILPWTSGGADLTPFLGQQITVEFIALDCLLGGHGGTAYVEARVEPLEIQVEGLCLSGPNDIILTAPLGFDAYLWSTGETTRAINVAGAQYGDVFTVDLTSNTGCNTSAAITLMPVDGATIDPIADQEICLGGTAIILPTGTNVGDFSFPDLGTTGNSAIVTPDMTTTYTVIARDENGCDGELTTVTITVLNSTGSPFPNADFELENIIVDNASPCNTVQLNNLSDYCKDDLTYLWDFGDGTTSTEENPLHTFPDSDTEESYTVTLTVTSAGDGLTDFTTQEFTTSTIEPSFAFVENCGQLNVTNTSTICGGNFTNYQNFSYAFNFGDGTPLVTTDESQVELNHTYAASGDYTITLVMTDNNSDFEETSEEMVTVTLGLTANFEFSMDCFDVEFTDTSIICDPISSWSWDFGDGSPLATEQNPLHVYTTEGPHTVTLTIDDGITTDAISMEVLLTPDLTIPDFSFIASCDEVQFLDESNSCAELTYQWDFGDGSPVDQTENPVHVFDLDTPYDVALTVNDGMTDFSITQIVLISSEFNFNTPFDMTTCEEIPGSGSARFNLLEQSDFMLSDFDDNGNFFPQLSYHLSLSDAESDVNQVSTQYTNISNPQELFVRIEDSQACFRIASFSLETFSTPEINAIADIELCAANESTKPFDLNELNAQVFEGMQQGTINLSYHENQNNAENDLNPTTSINLVAGQDQTIFIRAENTSNENCYSIGSVNFRLDNEETDTENRCMPFFSNTMTPNGDGANDTFYIENVDAFPNNSLTVYNRWGNIVYDTKGYLNEWNGTFNGKPLPVATYYFVFETGEEESRKHSGYISILK